MHRLHQITNTANTGQINHVPIQFSNTSSKRRQINALKKTKAPYLRVSCYASHLSSTTLKIGNLLPKPDQLAC